MKKNLKLISLAIVICYLLVSCSTGRTNIKTVAYYGVPSGDNTNYYRVNIESKSKLSKLKYESGWYPESALDRLFGNVSSDATIKVLETQDALTSQYNEKIISLNNKWLEAASNIEKEDDELLPYLRARRRLLAYPAMGWMPLKNSIELEYNPEKSLAIAHSNEKFAIVISANPNEVVGKISSFAESDKTTLEINKLSKLLKHNYDDAILEMQSVYQEDYKFDTTDLRLQLELLNQISQDGTSQDVVLREVQTLIELIKSTQ